MYVFAIFLQLKIKICLFENDIYLTNEQVESIKNEIIFVTKNKVISY